MAFWTYILSCSDGRYYTGHTEDLEIRLAQHQQGYFRNCWTYKRRPVQLVWSEAFPTRYEALEAERRVGGWSKAKKEALIRGDYGTISYFARPPREREVGFSTSPRFSTSLEKNEEDAAQKIPFVSSEVEKPV
jgi:putative endonuclease